MLLALAKLPLLIYNMKTELPSCMKEKHTSDPVRKRLIYFLKKHYIKKIYICIHIAWRYFFSKCIQSPVKAFFSKSKKFWFAMLSAKKDVYPIWPIRPKECGIELKFCGNQTINNSEPVFLLFIIGVIPSSNKM